MKLFTVVIPAYNAEKYLRRCLDSICYQNTNFDYEVIVVNDGSTDSTEDILREYRRIFSIEVISQENHGVSCARNVALKLAKGKYVVFVDADDYILPGYFDFLGEVVSERSYSCVFLNYYTSTDSTNPVEVVLYDNSLELTREHSIKLFLLGSFKNSPCNKIFDRNLARKILFPENITVGEDALFLCEAINSSEKNYISPKAFYVYMQDTGGVTKNSFTLKKLKDMSFVMTEIGKSVGITCINEYRYMVFEQMVPYIFNKNILNNVCSSSSDIYFDCLPYIRFYKLGTFKKKLACVLSKIIRVFKT